MTTVTPETRAVARAGAASTPTSLSARTWVIAVVLTGLCGWWVCQAEILTLACQITESVPAIPGLAALAALLVANPILARLAAAWRPAWLRPFSRAELLVIFLFVAIATSMMGVGVMRFLIALITAPFYFDIPDQQLTRQSIPHWLAPHNVELIRRLYESDPTARVPSRRRHSAGERQQSSRAH